MATITAADPTGEDAYVPTRGEKWIAEALRRDAELDTNSSLGMSLEQLDEQIERRRRS